MEFIFCNFCTEKTYVALRNDTGSANGYSGQVLLWNAMTSWTSGCFYTFGDVLNQNSGFRTFLAPNFRKLRTFEKVLKALPVHIFTIIFLKRNYFSFFGSFLTLRFLVCTEVLGFKKTSGYFFCCKWFFYQSWQKIQKKHFFLNISIFVASEMVVVGEKGNYFLMYKRRN